MKPKLLILVAGACLLFGSAAWGQANQSVKLKNGGRGIFGCDDNNNGFCLDLAGGKNYEGKYSGHDEPAIGFYSNQSGSGRSSIYLLTLPKDPPTQPAQDGNGGVFNFQLHPTFWFGVALCDSQSAPNFTNVCVPGTDANIFDNPDPNAKDWIGRHPGTAFIEMQFYPPGWIGTPFLSDATQYFSAMVIFSFGQRFSDNVNNNADCAAHAGIESANAAVVTLNGVPLAPPDPLGISTAPTNPDVNNILFMDPGDRLLVILQDTPAGLQVIIKDLTTGQSGTMTAGPSTGFAQVNFQPDPDPKRPSVTCSETPYAFRPMYDTSSEHTRIVWAAHTTNVAMADEIGHFEYCNAADPNTLLCTSPGVNDAKGVDADDQMCGSPGGFGLPTPPFIPITGCIGEDDDFDGVPYQLSWPGTLANSTVDRAIHAQPIRFSSPLFIGKEGLRNYDRVAFETNVIVTEAIFGNCNVITGANCVVPPPGANFYPFFTLRGGGGGDEREDDHSEDSKICKWQIGGNFIPRTTQHFGGNATAGFGPLAFVPFQNLNSSVIATNDNRRIVNPNPCHVELNDQLDKVVEKSIHLEK
jgi:hypothetical protein